MSRAALRVVELNYVGDEGRYRAFCPWIAVNGSGSLVFAAIVGTSLVLRGMVAALRTGKVLDYRLPGKYPDLVKADRPFRVFYDRGSGDGSDRLAIVITDPKTLNRVEVKKGSVQDENIPERVQVAYAFGTNIQEIAFDLCDQLDIPLLPSWSEDFIREIRNCGWLKRIPSSGIEYVWEFSAKRSEYLRLVADGLGTLYKPGALDCQGWQIRSIVERTRASIADQNAATFSFSKRFEEQINERLVFREFGCPEAILIEHRAGRCSHGFEPLIRPGAVEGGFELTTYHHVNSRVLELSTLVSQDTKTNARFIEADQALAA